MSASLRPPSMMPLLCTLQLLLCSSTLLDVFPLALATTRHRVSHLPGFHGPLPFNMETGYVGVDDVQLFYYFVPSEREPAEDPLVLWLTGGPGCSCLCALADEIGPVKFLKVRYDGSLPTLELNPYSWTKVANIIFLDFPVGAGFSFSRNPEAYNVGDTSSSKQVQTFMRRWLDDHPQFIPNPFYVAGDSYAGKTVPVVTHFISEGIRAGDRPLINLKGYAIGNPVTGDDRVDEFSRIPFLHGMGIISDEIYELTTKHCEGQHYVSPETPECAKNLDVVKHFLSEINAAYVLDPWCPLASPRPENIKGERRSLQDYSRHNHIPLALPDVGCREYNFYLLSRWANNDVTREALNVQKGTVGEWQRCSDYVTLHYTRDVESAFIYHLNLTTKGYRALVYSGDHDAFVPSIGTQAWIKSLNFSIVDDWRSWSVDNQVAGYTRSYSNNLTFATVKGAGHTAPEYRPKECLAMFQRWISQSPL